MIIIKRYLCKQQRKKLILNFFTHQVISRNSILAVLKEKINH
jgi:hypothetical protein